MLCARVERLSKVFEAKRDDIEGRDVESLTGIVGLPAQMPNSIEAFDAMVSTLYKWFIESVKADLEFLIQSTSVDGQEMLRRYRNDLKALRHAKQHNDAEQQRSAERWFRHACRAHSPTRTEQVEECGRALVQQTEHSLGVLIAMANAANKDPFVRSQWAALLGVQESSLDASLELALQLVDRHARDGTRRYLLRELESQWPRYLSGPGRHRPQHEALASSASLTVTKWLLTPLACTPDSVLAAAASPQADASSILVLAHAIQESGVAADELALKTAEAWAIIRAAGIV